MIYPDPEIRFQVNSRQYPKCGFLLSTPSCHRSESSGDSLFSLYQTPAAIFFPKIQVSFTTPSSSSTTKSPLRPTSSFPLSFNPKASPTFSVTHLTASWTGISAQAIKFLTHSSSPIQVPINVFVFSIVTLFPSLSWLKGICACPG